MQALRVSWIANAGNPVPVVSGSVEPMCVVGCFGNRWISVERFDAPVGLESTYRSHHRLAGEPVPSGKRTARCVQGIVFDDCGPSVRAANCHTKPCRWGTPDELRDISSVAIGLSRRLRVCGSGRHVHSVGQGGVDARELR